MSASGTGPFENDFALDFCDEIRGLDPEQVIAALRTALAVAADTPDGEYLERNVGEPAVAAGAIAVAKNQGRTDVLEGLELESVIPAIPADLFPHVIAALERTLQEDSETRRLWDQAGAGREWASTVESLVVDARAQVMDES